MLIRTRFSPSPTGMIHLGNARAALFNALFAKKNAGTFVLRIEDTDAVRSEERFTEMLQEDLHWLNIYWQEGPGIEGPYGPYWQSKRQHHYAHYYQLLEEKKLIYPCFCTDQELLLARKVQLSRGQAPRYSGTCRKLTQEEIDKRLAAGQKPAWRFIVPHDKNVEFVDIVKGPQVFHSNDMGDFIVRRADGTAPFLFCNAIDDALMEVSHVLRGEDHLANTPRQLLLLQTLNLHTPQYGHLSLIVGNDGAPLSKRHGSFSVEEMQKKGFLAIAVINYLARLGHTCDAQELLEFEPLAEHFHIDKLSRSPARFDLVQLMYWQKLAVQALSTEALWHWLGIDIAERIPETKRQLFADTVKANIEFPADAAHWADIFFKGISVSEEQKAILIEAGDVFFVKAEQLFDQFNLDLPKVLNEMKQSLNINGKKLFMPLRIALTGQTHGPELAHIVELLGQDEIKRRLRQVKEHLTASFSVSK